MDSTHEEAKLADFFEPVEYPTIEAVEAHLEVKAYCDKIMAEDCL